MKNTELKRNPKLIVHPYQVDIKAYTQDAPIGGKLLATYENPSDVIVRLASGPGAGTLRIRFDKDNGCIAIYAETSLQIVPQSGNKVLILPDNFHTDFRPKRKKHA